MQVLWIRSCTYLPSQPTLSVHLCCIGYGRLGVVNVAIAPNAAG